MTAPDAAGLGALELDDIPAAAGALLAEGASDRRAPAHTPAVASVGADGMPAVRTVVLRGADWAGRRLRFHTDRRSDKARDYAANPSVAVHVYDPARKLQLRLYGAAAVATSGPRFDAAWTATRAQSRACYQMTVPPGEPVPSPEDVMFDPELTDDGAAHFAIVEITVARFDWLWLSHLGHRRAQFAWTGDGWRGGWCAP